MTEVESGSDPFVDYYVRQSELPETVARFERVMRLIERVRTSHGLGHAELSVADIGCNTGVQSLLWAQGGHTVCGLEINDDLVNEARSRCAQAGFDVEVSLGTATEMPWSDESFDVCLMPELLEHVVDWNQCLDEAARILRPGGVLYVSTTNKLCPRQMEFDLPLYSWYPGRLKRYYERLAVTDRPELVNFATYPAVNWFSPYGLIKAVNDRGFSAYDHFSFADKENKGLAGRLALRSVNSIPFLKLMAFTVTPFTIVVAVKGS
jgi:2-polyprenyl-6-hydroxyphenyl methylase/3-demethylubiquinone-9 3-methyltransferase